MLSWCNFLSCYHLTVEGICPRSVTTLKETYFDTLLHVREAVMKKRPDKLSRDAISLHDNARSHEAQLIAFLLNDFHWHVFGHFTHLPDFAPSDYCLVCKP